MTKLPDHPQRLRFKIGGFEAPWHTVKWERRKLVYETAEFACAVPTRIAVPVTTEQWQQFWTEVEKAGVWSWRSEYSTVTLDGTEWSLELAREGRQMKSLGLNGYPGSDDADYEPGCAFDVFLKALMRLTGRNWYPAYDE